MFIEERHRRILELLHKQGRIEVGEISRVFAVSEDSARRDLRLMEQKGLVTRTYGGAILPEQVSSSLIYPERRHYNLDTKSSLAQLAATRIQNSDTLLLDGSSTVAMITSFLGQFTGLTVITNSVALAFDILESDLDVRLYMIGGIVERSSFNTASIESVKTIRQLNADKVFLGPCGISPRWGLSATSFEEAEIKKAMLEAGREVFIMADSSKFGQRFLANIGPLKPEYQIITDSGLGEEIRSELGELISGGLRLWIEGGAEAKA
jgi:DeoR family transcriptional regulator of aga operon